MKRKIETAAMLCDGLLRGALGDGDLTEDDMMTHLKCCILLSKALVPFQHRHRLVVTLIVRESNQSPEEAAILSEEPEIDTAIKICEAYKEGRNVGDKGKAD